MLFVVVICIIVLFVFILTISYYPSRQRITKGGWLVFRKPDDYKEYLIKRGNPINILRVGSAPLHNQSPLSENNALTSKWDATDFYIKKIVKDNKISDKMGNPETSIKYIDQKSFEEYERNSRLLPRNLVLIRKQISTQELDYRKFISTITPLDRVVHVALNPDSDAVTEETIYDLSDDTRTITKLRDFHLADARQYGITFARHGIRYRKCDIRNKTQCELYLKNLPVHDDPDDRIMDYDFIVADNLVAYNIALVSFIKNMIQLNLMKRPGLYIEEGTKGPLIEDFLSGFPTGGYRVEEYDNIYNEELKEWVKSHIPKLAEEHVVTSPYISDGSTKHYDPVAMKLPFYISMFIFGRITIKDVDLMKTRITVIYREQNT